MHIIVDDNVLLAEEFFSEFGEVICLPTSEITNAVLKEADMLICRSTLRVDEALLKGTRVRFVGSPIIGTDHVDLEWLESAGIHFTNAPGCNADSVVDYVLSSLWHLAEQEGFDLQLNRRFGVVGAGQVGSRLIKRLESLGAEVLVCDPPRALAQESGEEAAEALNFVDIDHLVTECDVICVHTPMVTGGEYPTHHLINAERIRAMKPGSVLLSAGRGGCVDTAALKQRLLEQADLLTVLDVWENEPDIDAELASLVDIATPHIAGHSLDGKMQGTEIIYQQACRHFGLPARRKLGQLKPDPWLRKLVLTGWAPPEEALGLCVRACYDVRRDALGLRRYQRRFGNAEGFLRYRREYPLRREFSTLRVELKKNARELREVLEGFGFSRVKLASK
ncbi:4-phosphoerythronate dehydrogenase PdxB [Cobetia marina]|uniref:4-phosphoerythronate dehydrogenase PdxB n=1 Tax=Cobetia TaxID=204286 RepID=UPI00159690F3|nr:MULTISPECIES: 4-phosphoerythronate dehydrogenase PdxB [Cobetia]MDN2657609.1 4-phosphoerythronate dehydrogenase PdxB [Cobetia sp. 14N.309.X.WAT.E.A4]MDO6788866.1 4-phosphoerythronate dehydrogenase PdxB [Cobetia marina]